MGSIKYIKRSKCGGQPPGKIKASLDEKLKNVEWGEYRLGNLFDVDSWEYGKNKNYISRSSQKTEKSLPVISGVTENNGVNYYTEDEISNDEIFESELTISTRGEYSGTVFYQPKKFVLANNILVMKMPGLTPNQKLFIGGLINSLNYGGYSGYPRKETLKNDIINLPLKDKKIDFDFMESFIAELEAERIVELNAYLSASRLDNYELSDKEMSALADFEALEWKDFKLTEILTAKNTRSILSSSIIEDSGTTPYLCASAENNNVSSYIDYDKNMLDEGNCIFIGGKTFVISYQKEDFYSNDSHNLALYLIDKKYRKKLPQLYLATCIYKSLKHKYSWGDSISKQKIQSDFVTLPIKNNQPNFEIMETFISAVEKLVIKDVVLYADRKIKATKDVINK